MVLICDTPARAGEGWWITTGLAAGGLVVMGPFASYDLAFQVRMYREESEGHHDYWVEQLPGTP